MAAYRAYLVDTENHIRGVPIVIEADTDEQAVAEAGRFVAGRDVELWRGDKMLARLTQNDPGR
jgi:hypothetical protein